MNRQGTGMSDTIADDPHRISKVTKVIDHGYIRLPGKPRYEQVFDDGTVVFSDTLPDRNAWKIWAPVSP